MVGYAGGVGNVNELKIDAFTIGNMRSYEPCFAPGEPQPTKIGRTDDYPGGAVFRTREDAEAWLKAQTLCLGWGVYGLILPNGWDVDVSSTLGPEGYFRLLYDALLVRLPS